MTGDRSTAKEAQRRRAVLLGMSLVAAGSGFWLGEAGGLPGIADLLAVLAFTAFSFALHRGFWLRGAVATAAVLGVFMASWAAGSRSSQLAYNECIDRGEEVRRALAEFRSRTGGYPPSLDELRHQLPCRRVLRGSVLGYKVTESGYDLRFGDRLISHSANESEGFTAHK
jgi:hypothetical protein